MCVYTFSFRSNSPHQKDCLECSRLSGRSTTQAWSFSETKKTSATALASWTISRRGTPKLHARHWTVSATKTALPSGWRRRLVRIYIYIYIYIYVQGIWLGANIIYRFVKVLSAWAICLLVYLVFAVGNSWCTPLCFWRRLKKTVLCVYIRCHIYVRCIYTREWYIAKSLTL